MLKPGDLVKITRLPPGHSYRPSDAAQKVTKIGDTAVIVKLFVAPEIAFALQMDDDGRVEIFREQDVGLLSTGSLKQGSSRPSRYQASG